MFASSWKKIEWGMRKMQKTVEELVKRREEAILEMKKNKKARRFNRRLIERLNKEIGLRLMPLV